MENMYITQSNSLLQQGSYELADRWKGQRWCRVQGGQTGTWEAAGSPSFISIVSCSGNYVPLVPIYFISLFVSNNLSAITRGRGARGKGGGGEVRDLQCSPMGRQQSIGEVGVLFSLS